MSPGGPAGGGLVAQPSAGSLLFSFRGRIGRGQYWLGLAAVVGVFWLALLLGAMAMNPTGAGTVVFLAFPLLALMAWIYAAVTVKRVRDAGRPAWSSVLFIALPLLWIPVAIETGEQYWFAVLPVQALLFALPGLMGSAPRTEIQSAK